MIALVLCMLMKLCHCWYVITMFTVVRPQLCRRTVQQKFSHTHSALRSCEFCICITLTRKLITNVKLAVSDVVSVSPRLVRVLLWMQYKDKDKKLSKYTIMIMPNDADSEYDGYCSSERDITGFVVTVSMDREVVGLKLTAAITITVYWLQLT